MRIKFIILSALIVIVVGMILLAFFSAQSESADKHRLADVSAIYQALKDYYNDNGLYPNGINGQPVGLDSYLAYWPKAPNPGGACTSDQNTYSYSQKSLGADYQLTFCLGGTTSGIAAGPHILSSEGIR